MTKRTKSKLAFGDFQTPNELAMAVCRRVSRSPASIIEPTCGVGNFLVASRACFGSRPKLLGVEISQQRLDAARAALATAGYARNTTLHNADFFTFDWDRVVQQLDTPILVIGNPPWVTNAALGALNTSNLPEKSDFQNHNGIDAITGKSNFDISEWMTLRLLEALAGRDATVALLLKVAVARKILLHAWSNDVAIRDAGIRMIDAKRHFGAAVDACLFSFRTDRAGPKRATVYESLAAEQPSSTIGVDNNVLLADVDAYEQTAFLIGEDRKNWRSGIKHDCSKVYELVERDGSLFNGMGEIVAIEDTVLHPMLKSSDVANGVQQASRWLVVPQRETGEDTSTLRRRAPRAWAYLNRHAERLGKRKSSIYRNRPAFSIFGVGDYAFAPWKVAISGLYKRLHFLLVPPVAGKAVVFDDTVYFLPCWSEAEAVHKVALLNSSLTARFFAATIFWDAKRPVTAKLLRQLDLDKLATALNQPAPQAASRPSSAQRRGQLSLL